MKPFANNTNNNNGIKKDGAAKGLPSTTNYDLVPSLNTVHNPHHAVPLVPGTV